MHDVTIEEGTQLGAIMGAGTATVTTVESAAPKGQLREEVNCISIATRPDGIPICVRWLTRPRRLWRMARLAFAGPKA